MGQPIEAEIAVRGAIANFEWLANNFPKEKQYRGQQGHSHHQLAVMHEAAQRPLEALAEYRAALEVAEKFVVDFPDLVDAWEETGHRSRYMAWQLISMNRYSEAESAFARAVQVFDQARTLTSGSVEGNLFQTADTHRNMAEVNLLQQRPQDAEVQYRRAVEVYCSLSASLLTDKDRRGNVKLGISSLVGLLKSAKRPDDAVAVLRQSIDFYARLSAEMPADPTFRQEVTELASQASHLLLDAGLRE